MANQESGKDGLETLLVTIPKGTELLCSEMFGRGVRVAARVGVSVREVLCGQIGVAPDYLDNRIQTVFLEGKPVDDTDHAVVEDGAVLSLSAAMPGLVGATLRKGGHLAPMRRSISYVEGKSTQGLRPGHVTLKLFNLVARELGPLLLHYGVIVSGKRVAGALGAAVATRVERNGKPTSKAGLAELFGSDAEVLLKVETIDP